MATGGVTADTTWPLSLTVTPRGIAPDLRGRGQIDAPSERNSFGYRFGLQRRQGACEEAGQVDRLILQDKLARLDSRIVEHVVDNDQERSPALHRQLDKFELLGVQGRVPQELGETHDPVQRRADFVAHHGEKLALRAVGHFGCFAGTAQVVFEPFAVGDIAEKKDAAAPESKDG